MLTYKDILYSFTKILDNTFPNIDTFVDDMEGLFDSECFYVSTIPISYQASTSKTNSKNIMVSVKYFSNEKLKIYDMADSLQDVFNRSINVKDRSLTISNIEPNFINDEIGLMLDFLIYLNFNDDIKIANVSYDNMQEIKINEVI